jgi:type IV secretion system protein VirB8
MSDIAVDFRALPILDPEREEYHKSVRSFQAHRVIDTQRRLRTWFWMAIAAFVLDGFLATAVVLLLPLKTTVPLFLVVREDGTVDTGMSLADLGADQAQKVIRSSVWRYVEEREAYSISEAKYRYDLISLMSNENVRRDYQNWFLRSPDSPQKVYGKNGQVSVKEISMSPVRDGVYLVRFWRFSQLVGEHERKTSATATVEYELLNAAPASLVLEDPAAISVVRYQVEENTAQ